MGSAVQARSAERLISRRDESTAQTPGARSARARIGIGHARVTPMHTLLAERLARAERKRAFWPNLWQAIGKCCECLVWFLVIVIGHVLFILMWLGR